MAVEELLIDADGHILEPPDLWEKNLEAKYRGGTKCGADLK